MPTKHKILFHPFLLALYPVLSFWVTNKNFVLLSETYRTAAICLGGASLPYLLIWLISRNNEKSALLASVGVVIFLYFGFVYYAVRGISPYFGQPLVFFSLWLVLFCLVSI